MLANHRLRSGYPLRGLCTADRVQLLLAMYRGYGYNFLFFLVKSSTLFYQTVLPHAGRNRAAGAACCGRSCGIAPATRHGSRSCLRCCNVPRHITLSGCSAGRAAHCWSCCGSCRIPERQVERQVSERAGLPQTRGQQQDRSHRDGPADALAVIFAKNIQKEPGSFVLPGSLDAVEKISPRT